MRIMPFMKRKKGIQFAGAGLDTGGGGTTDYDDLSNKPQIGGVTLTGNKTPAQLGLQSVLTFDNVPTANSDNPVKSGGVATALSSKFKIISIAGITGTYSSNELLNISVTTNISLRDMYVCSATCAYLEWGECKGIATCKKTGNNTLVLELNGTPNATINNGTVNVMMCSDIDDVITL